MASTGARFHGVSPALRRILVAFRRVMPLACKYQYTVVRRDKVGNRREIAFAHALNKALPNVRCLLLYWGHNDVCFFFLCKRAKDRPENREVRRID